MVGEVDTNEMVSEVGISHPPTPEVLSRIIIEKYEFKISPIS